MQDLPVGLSRALGGLLPFTACGGIADRLERGRRGRGGGLRSGAVGADGVIHLAYIHDFSKFEDNARVDLRAIQTLGEELEGSDRPLVIASGVLGLTSGRAATEEDAGDTTGPVGGRRLSEHTLLALASRGVRSASVRLAPTVHGEGDHGFVSMLIAVAREKGLSGYVGDGSTRWPAVHRLDAARLFGLALEQAPAGTVLHGVGEEGVTTREIAEAIGRHLDIPVVSVSAEDATEHFGFLGAIFAMDGPASSALTRERMGWTPMHSSLIQDLDAGHYFEQVAVRAS